jgi:hypothetical protein
MMKSERANQWAKIGVQMHQLRLGKRSCGPIVAVLERVGFGHPVLRDHTGLAVGNRERGHPVPQARYVNNAYQVAPTRLCTRRPLRVLTIGDRFSPFGDSRPRPDSLSSWPPGPSETDHSTGSSNAPMSLCRLQSCAVSVPIPSHGPFAARGIEVDSS